MGTLTGLVLCNIIMWWYWAEAHEFIVSPLAISLWGTALVSDATYPFLLRQVRWSEFVQPSGRVTCGGGGGQSSALETKHGKKRQ